ncbi:MAG TPA: heavy metal translocating P-type ATPase metal-binding domain-containing protein [Cryomorphaceae bacterium]|nr:heavy metal translocating P-type ATPase metal-binding domain-containing protein [Cryomorphaceae bacterium]
MSQKKQAKSNIDAKQNCFHCGDLCESEHVFFDEKSFCCHGCKSVYELLKSCDLDNYYTYAETPGIKRLKAPSKNAFAYLDDPVISRRIVQYSSAEMEKVKFRLPAMHCASCIWLIENFKKLVPGVMQSRVNFVKREGVFTYNPAELSLRRLVEQLASIGYEPELNFNQTDKKPGKRISKRLVYQIGVAGFCFGNIMLLSFPEYLSNTESVSGGYRRFFGILNFSLALPVLLFSARDYLQSGWRAIMRRRVNMDVPISLGILALFLRSSYEIFIEGGGGYMDSLAALIFFLLIGKWIQQRTYDSLSFERDYKSYFPISVQRIKGGAEVATAIDRIAVGDRFRVRSGELIPVDAELVSGKGKIDYSFVSGESEPVNVKAGEGIFAGGRQVGASIELRATKRVDQSYLTSLWNTDENQKDEHELEVLADRVGRHFTTVVILISILTAVYWYFTDSSVLLNAVSAVLIVACPCALALSFPFAFGNAVRLLGRQGFYLKNTQAMAKMAEIKQIVFDKTGTLTRKGETEVTFEGIDLSETDTSVIFALTSQSSHPLSRYIAAYLGSSEQPVAFEAFREVPGKGLRAMIENREVRIGSAKFTGATETGENALRSLVYYAVDGDVLGRFHIDKNYHPELKEIISALKQRFDLYIVSGDSDEERKRMESVFGQKTGIYFNQRPHEKQLLVEDLRKTGKNTSMIGDGLNDAGALRASDFGVSVADDVFRFSPASDAILTSSSFSRLNDFFSYANVSLKVVKWSFVFSFLYNGVGIFFAVQGLLTPVIAAVLMPLSSLTVVGFVTIGTRHYYRKLFNEKRSTQN